MKIIARLQLRDNRNLIFTLITYASQIYFSFLSSSSKIGYCDNYKVTRPLFFSFFFLRPMSNIGTIVKLQEMSSPTLQFGLSHVTVCRRLQIVLSLFNFSFLFFDRNSNVDKILRLWDTNRIALWFAACSLCYIIYQRQILCFSLTMCRFYRCLFFFLIKNSVLEQLCSYKRVE